MSPPVGSSLLSPESLSSSSDSEESSSSGSESSDSGGCCFFCEGGSPVHQPGVQSKEGAFRFSDPLSVCFWNSRAGLGEQVWRSNPFAKKKYGALLSLIDRYSICFLGVPWFPW